MTKSPFAISLVLAFGLVSTVLPFSETAQAAAFQGVPENAGERCNTPPKGSGIIVGIYRGVDKREGLMGNGTHQMSRYRCFSSMEECRGWLRTMQSNYFTRSLAEIGCWRR